VRREENTGAERLHRHSLLKRGVEMPFHHTLSTERKVGQIWPTLSKIQQRGKPSPTLLRRLELGARRSAKPSAFRIKSPSIQNVGIRVPLIVDQEFVLLDGYTRYKAATELATPEVPIEVRQFKNRLETMLFIVEINVARRHLTVAQKANLGLKLLSLEKELAKERQIRKPGSVPPILVGQKCETREAGEKYGRGKVPPALVEPIEDSSHEKVGPTLAQPFTFLPGCPGLQGMRSLGYRSP